MKQPEFVTRDEFRQYAEDTDKRLTALTDRLRRDQVRTSRRIDLLQQKIEGVPAVVKQQLDAQTVEIRMIVAESETANADRIAGLARQWPAGSIILATSLAALIVAVVAFAIARAAGAT